MSEDEAIKTLTTMERAERIPLFREALRWAVNRAAVPTLDEVAELLARELPDGYTIKLTLEKGCGSVDVDQWNDADYDMAFDGEGSIEVQLLLALKACKDTAKELQP